MKTIEVYSQNCGPRAGTVAIHDGWNEEESPDIWSFDVSEDTLESLAKMRRDGTISLQFYNRVFYLISSELCKTN